MDSSIPYFKICSAMDGALLWPLRFQNRADLQLRTSEQISSFAKVVQRLDRYQPCRLNRPLMLFFCQGVCSHSIHQSDAMDQLGCWSTLYYGENKKMGLHATVHFLFSVSLLSYEKQQGLFFGGGAQF
jgi:hypothetical protein